MVPSGANHCEWKELAAVVRGQAEGRPIQTSSSSQSELAWEQVPYQTRAVGGLKYSNGHSCTVRHRLVRARATKINVFVGGNCVGQTGLTLAS